MSGVLDKLSATGSAFESLVAIMSQTIFNSLLRKLLQKLPPDVLALFPYYPAQSYTR